jgi:hypothetical protein
MLTAASTSASLKTANATSTTTVAAPPASPTSPGIIKPAHTAAPIKELRRSTRNAATADVHTLHKAERLTAKKKLEFSGISFTSFPNSKVIANLSRVGINLSSSDVVVIKNLEVDRLVLCANIKKNFPKPKFSSVDSDEEREDQL